MTETIDLVCFNCIHFRLIGGGCDAFPDGIDDKILTDNKHDKPLKDQGNNIVYEPIKEKPY